MRINPLLQLDGYKTDHRRQYPDGTTLVYSNLTARGSRIEGIKSTVFFGLQYYLQEYLVRQWDEFFASDADEVCGEFERVISRYCPLVTYEHVRELHSLGFLPIRIKAVPEGTAVPLRVPMMTICNTQPEFFWLTNMLETGVSNILWMPITAATIANEYRKTFESYADETCGTDALVPFQGHDFSYRGLSGLESACLVGAGHLTSFCGTDTIPAVPFVERYYGCDDGEVIGCSVPATEHSVMCLGGDSGEIETFRRLITETYPSGIVSVVSDTWDFWRVVTEFLPKLKGDIMARDGKVVIRPDSGDPVKIICGDPDSEPMTPERIGLVECLYLYFGGTVNGKGFKELDPHIGAIYGDSITMDRQKEILRRLKEKGYASSNIVLGIGSFTYQYNTRDTFGMAVKATYGEVNGEPRSIYKDPKTDDGLKRSMKGLLCVNDDFSVEQECIWPGEACGILETVFEDGVITRNQSFTDIRSRIKGGCHVS